PDAAAKQAETGRQMRNAMGHFATGVSVVTARGEGGAPVGTTANAISSVSLDPPLLLACLARSSETLAAIRAEGRFAVNVLAADQRHHSDRFAAKGAATLACEVEAIYPAGDHEIVVGIAHHLEHREPGVPPLLFYRGAYTEIQIEE